METLCKKNRITFTPVILQKWDVIHLYKLQTDTLGATNKNFVLYILSSFEMEVEHITTSQNAC